VSTETQTGHRADVLRASPQIFESRLLDKLSRIHPAVVPLIYVPAIVAFSVLALERVSVLEWIAYAIGGYLFWTISEYAIHRFVFHFEPEKGIGARLHWIIHGVHHDHPNDPLRLVMPPSVSVPLSVLFFGLFWLVLPLGGAFAVASGFFSGYLAYDTLLRPPPHAEVGPRPQAARAAHAAPLPGSHEGVRDQRPVVGRGLSDVFQDAASRCFLGVRHQLQASGTAQGRSPMPDA
jgi:dihydroceramide fatty acyl 2-hydroxylase